MTETDDEKLSRDFRSAMKEKSIPCERCQTVMLTPMEYALWPLCDDCLGDWHHWVADWNEDWGVELSIEGWKRDGYR